MSPSWLGRERELWVSGAPIPLASQWVSRAAGVRQEDVKQVTPQSGTWGI